MAKKSTKKSTKVKKNYVVNASVTYIIEAENEEEAIELAYQEFADEFELPSPPNNDRVAMEVVDEDE